MFGISLSQNESTSKSLQSYYKNVTYSRYFDETNEEASTNFDDDKFISKPLVLVYNIRFDAKK